MWELAEHCKYFVPSVTLSRDYSLTWDMCRTARSCMRERVQAFPTTPVQLKKTGGPSLIEEGSALWSSAALKSNGCLVMAHELWHSQYGLHNISNSTVQTRKIELANRAKQHYKRKYFICLRKNLSSSHLITECRNWKDLETLWGSSFKSKPARCPTKRAWWNKALQEHEGRLSPGLPASLCPR